jgi:hypothetical protein
MNKVIHDYMRVIPNGARGLAIGVVTIDEPERDQSPNVRSLGPSRTGIVCAARDDSVSSSAADLRI